MSDAKLLNENLQDEKQTEPVQADKGIFLSQDELNSMVTMLKDLNRRMLHALWDSKSERESEGEQ